MILWLLLGTCVFAISIFVAILYLGILADHRQTRIIQDHLATKGNHPDPLDKDPDLN